MTVDERFAAYTRSASFALTLSSAQIDFVVVHRVVSRLRERYPWYEPGQINFGTAEEAATFAMHSTARALARKGLVDVTVLDPPCSTFDIVSLSEAGRAVAHLLELAGFEPSPRNVPTVPCHPDDRVVLRVGGPHGFIADPAPPDRRWPAPDEDVPYLGNLRPHTEVPS